ncbi:pseudouridine synthase [Radiomyces spectabilis]|uniref:pseudouridine synthase n=1 Tax=Radiomyces spectabilis TaxID=64574 RepID=UPI0022205EE8|nr:pseudouridine synthase [Radiomyces spectabilis]KAI8369647.1 pseudouridine synthase [Radiomyces spectabilis]
MGTMFARYPLGHYCIKNLHSSRRALSNKLRKGLGIAFIAQETHKLGGFSFHFYFHTMSETANKEVEDTSGHDSHAMKRTQTQAELPTRRQRKRKAGDFRDKNDLGDVEYYFEHGLRKVRPYYFEYKAYAKGRWLGRTILEVFSQEFRDRSEKYYRYAIENGLITINDLPVTVNTIVKNSDVISHKIHRHEPPCSDKPVKIVYEDKDLYVIDKPGGIPVHPSGRYRHNTVLHVLRRQHNIPKLYPANRLDRLTSGLMLIALNGQRAKSLEEEMSAGQIRKEYVCRVVGEFPEEEIICDQPIKTISFKLSMNYVHEDGKPCKTIFQRISYNGTTSVVRCKPITGRTHQIRVHLRYLGYPIANDPLYGNRSLWSPMLPMKQSMTDEEAELLVKKQLEASQYESGIWGDEGDGIGGQVPLTAEPEQNEAAGKEKVPLDKCEQCSVSLLPDPKPEDLYIWLHAWRYAGNGWSYETELPEWAREDFDPK